MTADVCLQHMLTVSTKCWWCVWCHQV